ncbi:5598_t:CDS:2 [Entrophospora sp. SA101]|nr:5311_t:CDS:2 [Entrophospora sp. SA101]CAJ0637529.1 7109_t:CDS:2 [Entrophospora sp. SA101]CAJ0746391.1 3422_t:CDS:2 [Entrophospora sp. SA101]CAJ0748520.1 5598_t:CDS:2 [Entrophospora sp. SA101]CAJ0834342.1 8028_t:CDS:2 [Entrophospora sp. SA101]
MSAQTLFRINTGCGGRTKLSNVGRVFNSIQSINHNSNNALMIQNRNVQVQVRRKGPSDNSELRRERNEDQIVSRNEYVPANFEDITSIAPHTMKALKEVFRYQSMTKVQDAVLSQLPIEGDMFVKAKTGTGKTLAFLIPAIETMLRNTDSKGRNDRIVSIMILSPTRELAQQIATEAQKIVYYHPFEVHCLVGGERRTTQVSKLMKKRVDIVVGTPGRIFDLLTTEKFFNRQCQGIKTLILDEADQLLDMGFRDAIEDIISCFPKERQTFFFSATVSKEIRQVARFALNPDHMFIDTVDPNDVNTNLQVKQSYLVSPYTSQLHIIRKIIADHKLLHQNTKIIMFLPTKSQTILYASFIRSLRDLEVFELHSGKTQDYRTRISERFRRCSRDAILVTSDVSARGVDYPGVTLVLQIGAPSSREQYIHRLGRTGRAGKEGEGIILLAPFEDKFISQIKDLPIEKINMSGIEPDAAVEKTINMIDPDDVHSACGSFLGYYAGKSSTHLFGKNSLLPAVEELARSFGTESRISDSLLEKIGLGSSNRQSGGREDLTLDSKI